MTTTVSSKGQVVLPKLVRARLRLSPGTKLICDVQGDSVVLKPQSPRPTARELVRDEITGLRVTKRTSGGYLVTRDMVKAIMADFP